MLEFIYMGEKKVKKAIPSSFTLALDRDHWRQG